GTVTGNLVANSSGGAITETGALTVTGISNINAGAAAITLTQNNNFVGAVTLTNSGANNVAITDATGGLILAASNVGSGTLAITSSGGALTQTGPLVQNAGGAAGAVTINSGAKVGTAQDWTAVTSGARMTA